MKISREWLQTHFEKPLPNSSELSHALTFHAFEIESVENDVLDVKVTPNRGHDCLSHRGIAKEISAILNIPLKNDPFKEDPDLTPAAQEVSVFIEDTTLCPRYIAGYIKGVKVGPSPEWLVKRLAAMGQHSINNIVDATNYVMFNTGQPLHAFDAGKLKEKSGFAIEVRKAKKGEKMTALDGKEYSLNESMLVIADKYSDISIGIAGVKGGMASGIDETTKDIIIESANFNGVSVRKTARALNLRTDASQRFEQVIAPDIAAHGMVDAVKLVSELAGGEVVGYADEYPTPQHVASVSVTLSQVNKVLGISLSKDDVEDVFVRLGFAFEESGDTFAVSVPFERLDLTISEDLIEEVGRIIGYDKVPAVELPATKTKPEVNQNFAAAERVREDLVSKGYSEVFTSVFADKGEVAVSNKIGGDKPFLRKNLTDGLAEALKKNIQNKDLLGLKEVKLFEIGTIWKKGKEEMVVGMIREKEKTSEKPLADFVDSAKEYGDLPISKTERYQTFSKYPYIVRDVALWTPKGTTEESIVKIIREHAGDLLVREPQLFDRFEKGDPSTGSGQVKVSYAFRLVFQSFDRTLFDEDANHRMESIYDALKKEGYEIR